MEIFLKLALIGCLILPIPITVAAGPYPPAADEAGSTAVWKGDPAFMAWASDYENYIVGPEVGSTWKTPEKALGPAVGTSFDIVSLGRGGEITLIFDPPFKNGAGWDFAVFENSFSDVFLELAYVEVSSDGETFVRFDNDSLTNSPVTGFGAIDPTNIDGYGGKYRQGYGTPFDLADLAIKNDVLSGAVLLAAITHVRIVDIIGDGSFFDSDGDVIYDPYPTSGSIGFDLDAVGARYEKNASDPLTEIDPPTLISPGDGLANVALNPTLETGPFSAQNLPVENYHARTHWQIARDAAFDGLVADVISPVSLTSCKVSASTLEIDSAYFWRAKFIDNDGVESEWADASSFTTTAVSNDLNGNGIPDDQELETTSSVDLNRDGEPDVDQISDQFKVLNAAAGSGPVAVEASNPNVVIEYLETLDPAVFPDHDGKKPQQMLFGLMSFRLRVQNAGDQETLTVFLSDPAPAEHEWMKYDAVRGWHPYGDATFNPDRYAVILTIQDGAGGDSDGLENAIIIDPAGVGGQDTSTDGTNIPSSGSAGIGGSGGLGCFISTTTASSPMLEREIVRGIPAIIVLSCLVFIRMLYLMRFHAPGRRRP
ncbi:MAG: hypothetical protein KJP23_11935 [Deltaproteobacteria bacterium]|nr:hypothetical protein [Deltaproteobacteria bacterium]